MPSQSLDLTGGLAPEDDLFMSEAPKPPFDWVREGASFWLYDQNGELALPRVGIEAEPHVWHERRYQANFALADGRVLNAFDKGTAGSVFDQQGRAAILSAGPLTFECLRPFEKWRLRFAGDVLDTSTKAQMSNTVDRSKKTRLRYDVELTMTVPPNIQNITPAAFFSWGKGKQRDGVSVGLGLRFEQLFCGEGEYELDGKTRAFEIAGNRVKRRSVRTDGLFLRGHVWQAAVFPDGRAFHLEVRPVHDDGHEPWNEAHLYQNGRWYHAKVINPRFLSRVVECDEDVSIELQSELGTTHIRGSTLLSTFRVSSTELWGFNLQQAGARYTWDDQTAIGMIERSMPGTLQRA